MARTIIIGDIHGMHDELCRLLEACGYEQGADRVVPVGDIIHKGPLQPECVQLLRGIGAEPALGNHEDKQQRFRHVLERYGEDRALKLKGAREMMDLEEDLDSDDIFWLESAQLFVPVPGGVVVHAGIPMDLVKIPSPAEIAAMDKRNRKDLMRVLRLRHVRGRPRSTVQLRLTYDGLGLQPGQIDQMLEDHFLPQLASGCADHQTVHVAHEHRGGYLPAGSETEDDPFWTELYDGRFGTVYYGHQPWRKTSRPRVEGHTVGMDLGCVFGNRLAAAVLEPGKPVRYRTVRASSAHSDLLWD
jgi:hypothetical protein